MKDWKYVLKKLDEYKSLINFSDSMEKHNFKWVNQFITKNKRKDVDLDGSILVVETVIEMQTKRIEDLKKYQNLIESKDKTIAIAIPPGTILNREASVELAKYAANHSSDFLS